MIYTRWNEVAHRPTTADGQLKRNGRNTTIPSAAAIEHRQIVVRNCVRVAVCVCVTDVCFCATAILFRRKSK